MTQQIYFWVYIQKNWKKGLEEILYTYDHSNSIHNSKKAEATQVSTDG